MSQDQARQYMDQATQALQSGNHQQALELLDQAIGAYPNDSEAYVLKGIALSQSARNEEATEAFRKAITLGPYNAKAYFNLAVHQYQQGNKAEALQMAQEAARIDVRHTGARELVTRLETELGTVGAAPRQEIAPPSGIDAPPPMAPPTQVQPNPYAQHQGPYAQGPYGQAPTNESPYMRQGYDYSQSAHSIGFVEKMGGGWTAIGWVLSGLSLVTIVLAVMVAMQIMQKVQPGSQPSQADIQRMLIETPMIKLISPLSWIALIGSVLFTIIDLVDRRGNFVWLVPNVICGCCGFTWLVLPIYLLAGRK